MSIKRISRHRVAAPIGEFVDEDPLATRISTKQDTIADTKDNTRTGGDVETRVSPKLESSLGGGKQSRTGGDVETKYGMQ